MGALADFETRMQAIEQENELLKESLQSRVLDLEDVGWTKVFGSPNDDDGITLDQLHTMSVKLRELVDSNPWFIRGAQLRHSYIFGRGMNFVGVAPGAQDVLDDPHNKEVLFSVDAYDVANKAVFTDGQFTVIYNNSTRRFTAVPIKQISQVMTNPDDESDIWYVKRSWGQNKTRWIPMARHKRGNRIKATIDNVAVSKDEVAYVRRSRKQSGWTWGVPDSLGALIWVLAYSGYLQDNAQLVKALSKFAWTLTRDSSTGVANAATQVLMPGIGGTAIGAGGGGLASAGVPSAQVNMNNGQPLIAAVAASFGVPVIALLSSPGATGGSYGAATTLDGPTIKGFEALQDSWKSFYEEILRDISNRNRNASVAFPSIDTDAPYRQITSVAQAVELGIIWRDEARQAVLDILDVPKLHDDMPELPDYPDKSGTVVSKQGQSGTLGATTNPGSDTNHDLDADR